MNDKAYIWLLFLVVCNGFLLAGKTIAQDDVADVPCREFFAENDKDKRYFLIGHGEKIEAPEEGFSLVIVLPGGDGGAGFNNFVKRICKYSLSPKYLVAQLGGVL